MVTRPHPYLSLFADGIQVNDGMHWQFDSQPALGDRAVPFSKPNLPEGTATEEFQKVIRSDFRADGKTGLGHAIIACAIGVFRIWWSHEISPSEHWQKFGQQSWTERIFRLLYNISHFSLPHRLEFLLVVLLHFGFLFGKYTSFATVGSFAGTTLIS
jgi:hypothetical protein